VQGLSWSYHAQTRHDQDLLKTDLELYSYGTCRRF
jgi:hypothetical protein